MNYYIKSWGSRSFINDTHQSILKSLLEQIPKDFVLVDTSWLEIDDDFVNFCNNNIDKTFLLYSGPDWENTVCRKPQHDWIKNNIKNTFHIGNCNNKYYFNFWLEFLRTNFVEQDYKVHEIQKVFMCLNRKPHSHRVQLIQKIYENNLQNYGYISLGTHPSHDNPYETYFPTQDEIDSKYFGLKVPITLENDIENKAGEEATAGTYGITNDISSLGNINNWNTHFVNIVSETTIHSNVFLSEKTFKPILGMKPFMILGDNKVYKKLHDWGIDTFDDIFGKGYYERWHDDRTDWIVSTLRDLVKRDDLLSLTKKLQGRLLSNNEIIKDQMKKNKHKIDNFYRTYD